MNVLDFNGHRLPMISFPGNPVSTLISYVLMLRPYLRAGGPYGTPQRWPRAWRLSKMPRAACSSLINR